MGRAAIAPLTKKASAIDTARITVPSHTMVSTGSV